MNIDKILKNGKEYLMNVEFQRIKNGERIGTNNQPYSIDLYDNLISYFEITEEYEKCSIVIKEKEIILDHRNNYNKWMQN
jgi:hypothetical protein